MSVSGETAAKEGVKEQECAAIFALLYEVKQVKRVPAASVFVLMYK
jgi:hypothetical protein